MQPKCLEPGTVAEAEYDYNAVPEGWRSRYADRLGNQHKGPVRDSKAQAEVVAQILAGAPLESPKVGGVVQHTLSDGPPKNEKG